VVRLQRKGGKNQESAVGKETFEIWTPKPGLRNDTSTKSNARNKGGRDKKEGVVLNLTGVGVHREIEGGLVARGKEPKAKGTRCTKKRKRETTRRRPVR